jgi:hypothetical protein
VAAVQEQLYLLRAPMRVHSHKRVHALAAAQPRRNEQALPVERLDKFCPSGDMSAKCQSGFMTLPPVPLQGQPVVVLLLEMASVPWSLAMNEHGGHQDLRGSGRQSVIPYIHGRTELYCSRLSCLSLFFF